MRMMRVNVVIVVIVVKFLNKKHLLWRALAGH